MRKFIVEVTNCVEITLDETKFDAEFFRQFNESIHDFGNDLTEHARHLAVLYVRGVADNDEFIEGYGPAKDMGLKFHTIDEWDDLVSSIE